MAGHSKTYTLDYTASGDTVYTGCDKLEDNEDEMIAWINSLKKSYASSTAPSSPSPDEGQLWYKSDTNILKVYDGSNWHIVGIPVAATAPSSPQEGDLWWDSTNDVLKVYTGSAWKLVSTTVGSSALSSPQSGDLWWDSTNTVLKIYDGSAWRDYAHDGFRDGCRPEYKGDADIYIGTGSIEITNLIIEVSSKITVTWSDLDTGSEATSTWYYLYLDTSGSAHISATAPTSRYHGSHSTWRCVGSFYNNASGNIAKFYYHNDGWTQWDAVSFGNAVNAATPSDSWTEADCSSLVPSTATRADINYRVYKPSSGGVVAAVRKEGSSSTGNEILDISGQGTYDPGGQIRFPMELASQKFEYRYATAVTAYTYITCYGYEEDL